MHEGNFTEQIVEIILKALEEYPAARPTRVRVKVGEMLHLAPDSVRLHYATLTKGTRLEGANLDLEEEAVSVLCRGCRREGPVEDHHMPLCSACGSPDVELLSGDGVVIESIDFLGGKNPDGKA